MYEATESCKFETCYNHKHKYKQAQIETDIPETCNLNQISHYLCPMRKLSMDELNRKTVEEFKQSDKSPVVVVLDNVRSMHNVGSVFRTADAFLVESICLCGYTPRPPHRDIHKTALGATETVHWVYYSSTMDAINALKKEGYTIWAVEQAEGSTQLAELNWATLTGNNSIRQIAVIFGNEVGGVDEEVLKLCNGCIEIPQSGTKHSLNISVAAGIVLWELVKLINGTVKMRV